MELRQVKLFCLIAELGSVSAAAKAAGLGQPTVSQHLRSLEEDLGILLFERRGRRIVPTQAARVLYPFAKEAIQILQAAKAALEEHVGLVRGELHLAGSTIPGHYLLPGLMASFHKNYPGVELILEVGDTQWVIERVKAAESELGFVGAKMERQGLSFEPFATDELVLIASPTHPMAGKTISVSRLGELELISREPGSGTRKSWEKHLRSTGTQPENLRIVAQLGSTEAVVRAVKASMGVAVVSIWAVEQELARGELARIFLEMGSMERTFYLVRNSTRALSPAAQRFMEMAMQSASPRGGK